MGDTEIKNDSSEKDLTDTSLQNQKKNKEKEEKCKVIKYDPKRKTLDVMFKEYGIRIRNVESFEGETVIIKYKGEIGKKDFSYRL